MTPGLPAVANRSLPQNESGHWCLWETQAGEIPSRPWFIDDHGEAISRVAQNCLLDEDVQLILVELECLGTASLRA